MEGWGSGGEGGREGEEREGGGERVREEGRNDMEDGNGTRIDRATETENAWLLQCGYAVNTIVAERRYSRGYRDRNGKLTIADSAQQAWGMVGGAWRAFEQ